MLQGTRHYPPTVHLYQQSDLANTCMSSYPVGKSSLSAGQRGAEAQGWTVNFMGHFFIFVLNMHVCKCTKAHVQMCEAFTELRKQIYFTKMAGLAGCVLASTSSM